MVPSGMVGIARSPRRPPGGVVEGKGPAKERVCVLPGCHVPFPRRERFKGRNPLVPTGVRR